MWKTPILRNYAEASEARKFAETLTNEKNCNAPKKEKIFETGKNLKTSGKLLNLLNPQNMRKSAQPL
jgi:hypothetical protein